MKMFYNKGYTLRDLNNYMVGDYPTDYYQDVIFLLIALGVLIPLIYLIKTIKEGYDINGGWIGVYGMGSIVVIMISLSVYTMYTQVNVDKDDIQSMAVALSESGYEDIVLVRDTDVVINKEDTRVYISKEQIKDISNVLGVKAVGEQ